MVPVGAAGGAIVVGAEEGFRQMGTSVRGLDKGKSVEFLRI
jgi:hypothetical protein